VKTIVGLVMMMLSAAAAGQVLKCVAKDGKVEFASVCPPGTSAQKTGIRNAPASPAGEAHKSIAEREADFRKRLADKQEAEQKTAAARADAETKRDACARSRTYLKSLEGGIRIRTVDPKTGEQVFLDDRQRASEAEKAREAVSRNCSS